MPRHGAVANISRDVSRVASKLQIARGRKHSAYGNDHDVADLEVATPYSDALMGAEDVTADAGRKSKGLLGSDAAKRFASKATKGATKMGSALKKKMKGPSRGTLGGDYGSRDFAMADGPETIGAMASPIEAAEDLFAESDEECEDVSEAQRCLELSVPSSPSTQRSRSSPRTGMEQSSVCSGSDVEARAPAFQRSDNEESLPAQEGRPTSPVRDTRVNAIGVKIEWDSKRFGHVRPLQCYSIWDIPTSREPNPVPRPAPCEAALTDQTLPAAAVARHPGVSARLEKDRPKWPPGQILTLIVFALVLAVAAVIAAIVVR